MLAGFQQNKSARTLILCLFLVLSSGIEVSDKQTVLGFSIEFPKLIAQVVLILAVLREPIDYATGNYTKSIERQLEADRRFLKTRLEYIDFISQISKKIDDLEKEASGKKHLLKLFYKDILGDLRYLRRQGLSMVSMFDLKNGRYSLRTSRNFEHIVNIEDYKEKIFESMGLIGKFIPRSFISEKVVILVGKKIDETYVFLSKVRSLIRSLTIFLARFISPIIAMFIFYKQEIDQVKFDLPNGLGDLVRSLS